MMEFFIFRISLVDKVEVDFDYEKNRNVRNVQHYFVYLKK